MSAALALTVDTLAVDTVDNVDNVDNVDTVDPVDAVVVDTVVTWSRASVTPVVLLPVVEDDEARLSTMTAFAY